MCSIRQEVGREGGGGKRVGTVTVKIDGYLCGMMACRESVWEAVGKECGAGWAWV